LKLFAWKATFKYTRQHVFYVVGCALIIVGMAYFIDERALGSGKDLMTAALFTTSKYNPWYMPILRAVGSLFSFTTGASGGVFAPGLAAGASVGATISGWLHLAAANTNLLVLAGMVAFLTGITRTPFTSAILVLEMTDRHNVIFHLMLAGMVASLVAMVVDRHSFYDHLKYQYLREIVGEEEGLARPREEAELEE
jgi:H+/Cl- antiporter ClcA